MTTVISSRNGTWLELLHFLFCISFVESWNILGGGVSSFRKLFVQQAAISITKSPDFGGPLEILRDFSLDSCGLI